MTILERIVEEKKEEVARLKAFGIKPPEDNSCKRVGFKNALMQDEDVSIIAEVKKASPSKGVICKDFEPLRIANDYEIGGARAISVLTDEKFFQGSLSYLNKVKKLVSLPVLRKDFIIDHIQVEEADLWGADAILLICAILDDVLLKELLEHAKQRELDCLVEVHNEQEAERALINGATLLGINNRNLKDFSVSLDTTIKVRRVIPEEIPVVSESGIKTREDIERLIPSGIQAVLIGEHLVKSDNRVEKIRELLGQKSKYVSS